MTPCRICESKDPLTIFTKDGFPILRCRRCGLEFTGRDPSRAELAGLYGESYFKSGGRSKSYFDYTLEEEAVAANAKRRLAAIGKVRPRGGDLLDVGCATGFFLKEARNAWRAKGVELSEYASSFAREKYALDVKTGALRDVSYPADSFDVVTMWDVVEHLPSPLEDVREAGRILKDNGLLVLATGDVRSGFAKLCGKSWHLYNPSQHLSFFSEETIRELLKRAGFRVLNVQRAGSLFTLGYIASMLSGYYPYALLKSLRDIIFKTPLRSTRVSLNLGDIMTVYAEKAHA